MVVFLLNKDKQEKVEQLKLDTEVVVIIGSKNSGR